jgi:hypothetical protein
VGWRADESLLWQKSIRCDWLLGMRAFDIEVPKASMISTLVEVGASGSCSYPLCQKFVVNEMSR